VINNENYYKFIIFIYPLTERRKNRQRFTAEIALE